ncbi:MAG: carbohydrate-binding domain-containing protein [Bacteroidaceae bacterium]|nr:carbohydrate-binding domain-containing protein [Bacteroidaceae bacterium]
MKRTVLVWMALVLTMAATGQTLNVKVGSVVYQFPADQTGEMTYTDGTKVTIMGRTFALSDIDEMTVDGTEVKNNLVAVEYDAGGAMVYVAGNVAQYVEPTLSGAHVTIAQSNTEAVDDGEITYQLSGTTADGSLTLSGSYKCTVSLADVTLTNPSGAAINITNSKRIQISAKKGTTNTLTDGGRGEQKACIYSKGQIQLQGNGVLNVVGKTAHGIKSGDYISIKNLTLNIISAVSDGINCVEYFQMKSGVVNISGVGDDGIQCDLGGEKSTGETEDHDDEDSGNIYIEAGTLTLDVATKGIKAQGDLRITGGTITATSSGHEAIEAKGVMTIEDGTVYAFSKTDDAINSGSHMYLKGGTVTGVSNGNDGIDSNGNLYIEGGTVIACGTGQPECGVDAAERYKLYITGGTVLAIGGGNNTVTSTSGSQCVLSTTGSPTAGTAVSVKSGSTELASFTVPTGYSPSSGGFGGGGFGGFGFGGGGGRPGGGGQSGSSSFSYLLSCPGLTSGTSYTVTIGSSSSSCRAATSYSGR